MTFDIALVLAILVGAVILFVTEKLRVDVVAMLVLVTLALSGLIEPEEAVLIFVQADTKLIVDGEPKELDEVLNYLSPKLKNNPNKPVIIQTDPKAPYYAMVDVLDVLQRGKEELDLKKDINVAIPTQREIDEMWGELI